jgi:predicted ferric reductase
MTKVAASPVNDDSVILKAYRGLVIGLLVLVVGGALSITFVFESQTLWYHMGIDKTILRGGQMVGLLTSVLLFVQILLAVRSDFLKKLFGIANLMRWHRANGVIVSLLAISHVILILAPDGLTNLPIGKKYWPEMVGGLLLCIILTMVISSQFREKLRLDYKRWKAIHKLLGYFIIICLTVHVLAVSDSFEHTIPRTALLSIVAGVVVSVILSKIAKGHQNREQ